MSDADRWRHVDVLLHDDSIRHFTRIGGLFHAPVRPAPRRDLHDADDHPPRRVGTVSVAFDTVLIQMPEPLDELIREHMNRRGQASYVARDNDWLLPGR